MLDNRNPKQIRERNLGGRGPAGKPRNRLDDEVRKVTAILVNTRNCSQRRGLDVTAGRKQGRPWTENGSKSRSRREEDEEEEEEEEEDEDEREPIPVARAA
jgi:hypothetical protein